MKQLFVTAALLGLSLASATKVGDAAPNFKLADSSGKVVELSKLKGQPVVLTFWATWCPSCKQELPELNTALDKIGFKNHFAISPTDTSSDAWQFFADKGYKNKGKVAAQQSGLMTDEQYQANLLKAGFKAAMKR